MWRKKKLYTYTYIYDTIQIKDSHIFFWNEMSDKTWMPTVGNRNSHHSTPFSVRTTIRDLRVTEADIHYLATFTYLSYAITVQVVLSKTATLKYIYWVSCTFFSFYWRQTPSSSPLHIPMPNYISTFQFNSPQNWRNQGMAWIVILCALPVCRHKY